jgi:hypothetical protein
MVSIERQELYTDQWLQFNNVELADTFIDRGRVCKTFDRPDLCFKRLFPNILKVLIISGRSDGQV